MKKEKKKTLTKIFIFFVIAMFAIAALFVVKTVFTGLDDEEDSATLSYGIETGETLPTQKIGEGFGGGGQ